MSHHFDTPSGRADPRLNLCDFYLFAGRPGSTVMAMTVNPQAAAASAPLFREETLYAFRFDLDGDGRDDVSFTVRFGKAAHTGTGDHRQEFAVRRATGAAAGHGDGGELVAGGATAETTTAPNGITAFAGVVQDTFAGNAGGLDEFGAAMARGEYQPEAFAGRQNFFASRHVAAIVLEVPNELIGTGDVHAWASISLHGHAPEQLVARWGLPLITHLFLGDDESRETFNRTAPSADDQTIRDQIASTIRASTSIAGTAADPGLYAERVLDRLGLLTLPYTLGSPASFDFAGFNGRTLHDNVMDVMLSLLVNTPLANGTSPDPGRITGSFPYFALPVADA